MTDFETKLNRILNGLQCINFRYLEGGTLILYLVITTGDEKESETRLWIECAWRLRDLNKILIGSLDQPDAVLKNLAKVQGQMVKEVRVDEISMDLRVLFSNNLFIESFTYLLDDDVWEVRQTDGYRFGVKSGLIPFEKTGEND